MPFNYNIRLSGSGGHSLIQASRILAEAAAIYDGKNASESCSYGPEARGNASRIEIVISDEVIDYPKVSSVDFLLALTQEAYDKYLPDLSEKGIAVVDDHIKSGPEAERIRLFRVPLSKIAREECSNPSMINIVALGVFSILTDVLSETSIRNSLLSRVPKMSEDIYLQAYQAGRSISPPNQDEKG
jgi:2-oxoglutarate ferredoxin oxidoreductase subunit gamma